MSLLSVPQAQLPPFPNVLHSLVKAAWQSWRELLTRLTRSEIRHWVRTSASSRVAWKILKDPRCVACVSVCGGGGGGGVPGLACLVDALWIVVAFAEPCGVYRDQQQQQQCGMEDTKRPSVRDLLA